MNETRSLLAETCNRLFADLVTPDLLRAAEAGAWTAELWAALEKNGLSRALVPEAQGGAGLTWQDAYPILFAAGAHAAPVPLAETIVAGWLLARAGLDVPDGPLSVSTAPEALILAGPNGGELVSGRLDGVAWGGAADHVVAPAVADGRPKVALLARRDGAVRADRNIGRDGRDGLTFDAAAPLALADLPNDVDGDALLLFGALARSAQIAGAVAAVLDLTVQYAGDRVQFGRPLAKFQAVQHQLAVLATEAAAAQIAAQNACRSADRAAGGDDVACQIAVAKLRAGEAAGKAAAIGHQVHGAIGFTDEYSLHYLTRRLWSWRAEFGAEALWAERLGRAVAARGADQLWPDITARP